MTMRSVVLSLSVLATSVLVVSSADARPRHWHRWHHHHHHPMHHHWHHR